VTPGTRLLKIARLVFNERFIALVVRPTIADLQSEVAAAGPSQLKRLRVRCRGYAAFWTLILVAPFASWSDELPNTAVGPAAAGSAVVTLLTVMTLGASMAFVLAAGVLVAVLIHAWYAQHPSQIAIASAIPWRSPQINFSSTDVAGNVGGLIFVVGTVLIVLVGLPWVAWFLLAAAIAACFVAGGLVVWHTRARREDWTIVGRLPKQLF
jgi:hypothetical protein